MIQRTTKRLSPRLIVNIKKPSNGMMQQRWTDLWSAILFWSPAPGRSTRNLTCLKRQKLCASLLNSRRPVKKLYVWGFLHLAFCTPAPTVASTPLSVPTATVKLSRSRHVGSLPLRGAGIRSERRPNVSQPDRASNVRHTCINLVEPTSSCRPTRYSPAASKTGPIRASN
jgi:hypothetical protein